jgi:hypothetical protein
VVRVIVGTVRDAVTHRIAKLVAAVYVNQPVPVIITAVMADVRNVVVAGIAVEIMYAAMVHARIVVMTNIARHVITVAVVAVQDL